MKSTSEIRQAFLDYFTERGHALVPSSPLVPGNDPTLLFTNAGMVQFKDVFLGAEKRSYDTAVTAQRCVRAGGKHNDLDQVGYTARHHTFFEMLGNFSFGDYFKKEAIQYAWQLLTEVYGLPAGQLWVTVYESDDEAYEVWKNDIGIASDRLIRVGDKPGGKPYESDNFWAMGDTGPCGPCTEIFYDHGPEVAGGPPGSADEDGDRYIEVWNLVFMQYDRATDGSMNPLPKPCVDTGMGLERLAAILQGRHSNYQIDLFKILTGAAAEFTGSQDTANASLNVIADHIRACAFLITDGVLPSNEGRGYVLRRIIRRAIRHGYKLGQKQPFFNRMMDPLAAEMGTAYPELVAKAEQVKTVLLDEEQRFSRTLESGMAILDGVIEKARQGDQVIDGSQAFLLYDTYGFPLDLTEDVAREHQLTVDLAGFETAMAAQRQRARNAGQFSQATQISAEDLQDIDATRFTGYEETACAADLLAVLSEDGKKTRLDAGERGILILDKTPFYAESGGQVGDSGKIRSADFEFRVDDTQLIAGTLHGHYGEVLSGKAVAGDTVNADIDTVTRQAIVLHHSATHLLHAALRETLGSHVEQKGSLVAPDRLRFDFSHTGPVSPEQLQQIESLVNQQIRENPAARADLMDFDDAIEAGAMALFGEKYGEQVRVMRFGGFSVELCGGTHVGRVGDIGLFKIISETGIAAGVRRIEALAGQPAMDWVFALEDSQKRIARLMKTGADRVEEKVRSLLEQNRELEKSLDRLKRKMANQAGGSLSDQALDIEGVKLIAASLEGMDSKGLRETTDRLKAQLGSGVIVLASGEAGKVRLIAGVTSDLTNRVKAGDLVNYVAQQVGGKGGGRPDLAQAGGNDSAALPVALDSVAQWLAEKLKS